MCLGIARPQRACWNQKFAFCLWAASSGTRNQARALAWNPGTSSNLAWNRNLEPEPGTGFNPVLPESRLGLHAPCSMEPLYLLATSLATSRLDHPRQRVFMRTAMCIGSRLQAACPSRLAHMRSTVDSAAHTEHPQAACLLAAQTKRASYSEPTACRVRLKAITGNPQDAHRMQ